MARITKEEFLQYCKIRANIYEAIYICLPIFAPALEKFDGKVLNKRFINFAAGNEKGQFNANDLKVYASIVNVGSCSYIELYCSSMMRYYWKTKLVEIKSSFEVIKNNNKIDGRATVKKIVERLKTIEQEKNEYEEAIDNFEEVEKAFAIIEQEKSRIAKLNSHLSAYLVGNLMSY